LLNDNLCYFTYVGSWKEFSPEDIVKAKRIIDKKIYLAAPLFSKRFLKTCLAFQDLCYEIYTGTGRNARLKTSFEKRKEFSKQPWNEGWSACFSKEVSSQHSIRKAYQDVMTCFSDEIGINVDKNGHPYGYETRNSTPSNMLLLGVANGFMRKLNQRIKR
jgi:hypothetical protein